MWFHCVLRGDANFIQIGKRTNIRDGTIVHVDPGEFAAVIGDDVTIGHACIIHGCRLDAALPDRATVMNGAVIEQEVMLGAGGLFNSGSPDRDGGAMDGAPAKLRRVLTDEERRSSYRQLRTMFGTLLVSKVRLLLSEPSILALPLLHPSSRRQLL